MLAQLVVSTLLSVAASQVTLTAPNIGYDEEAITLAGSIVSVSPDATTVALGCGSQTDCGLFPAHTLVYGASTYNIDMSDPNTDFTATIDCVVAPSSATCRETAGGSEANFPGSSTEEYSEIGTFLIQITAGSEKLTEPASAKATPTLSSAMASGMSVSGLPTLSAVRSAASGVSASATSSGPAQASTAAAAGNAATIGGGLLGVAAGVFGGLLL